MLIVFAGVSTHAQEKKNKNAKHDIEVKGNCDQCKKRIEKAAYGVKGVKSAAWSEETGDLHLILDETKCTTHDVQTAVAKAGHDTAKVKATQDDYNGLHHCCQYDRS